MRPPPHPDPLPRRGEGDGTAKNGPALFKLSGAAGFLLVLCFYAARLAWLAAFHPPTDFYYHNSASQWLYDWWRWSGVLPGGAARVPFPSVLAAGAVRLGADILRAPLGVNILLGGAAVAFFYDALRRTEGPASASLAALLAVSVPAFGRLVFSARSETAALALTAAALWALGPNRSERAGLVRDAAALAALGLAAQARPEFIVFLGAAFGWICYRRRGPSLALLTGWFLFWGWYAAPGFLSHAASSQTVNRLGWGMDVRERLAVHPLWFLTEFFPLNLVLLGIVPFFRQRRLLALPGILLALSAGQAALLWAAFASHLGSPEVEQNVCAALFLAMAPAAAGWAGWAARRGGKRRAAVWAAVGLVAAVSWVKTIPKGPRLSEETRAARALGRDLRRLAAEGKLGKGLAILEVRNASWPDVLVFSGFPDRFRLWPGPGLGWGAARVWRGEKKVAVAIASPAVERELAAWAGALTFLEEKGGYRVFRLGT